MKTLFIIQSDLKNVGPIDFKFSRIIYDSLVHIYTIGFQKKKNKDRQSLCCYITKIFISSAKNAQNWNVKA